MAESCSYLFTRGIALLLWASLRNSGTESLSFSRTDAEAGSSTMLLLMRVEENSLKSQKYPLEQLHALLA